MRILATTLLLALAQPCFADLNEPKEPYESWRDMLESFGAEAQEFFGQLRADWGPKFEELMDELGDWSNYESPEVLPNGDIIIRRKPRLELEEPEEAMPKEPQEI